MTMNMAGFVAAYDPDIQGTIFDSIQTDGPSSLIVNEMSATEYETNIAGMTGLGVTGTQAEGIKVSYADPYQGYTKQYQQVTYGQGIQITKRLWSYDKIGLAMKLGAMLGDSVDYTRELLAINILNNGFTAAYAGADGKELFSLIHPLKGSGGTEQNELTTTATALSDSSLEEALYTLRLTVNHQGLQRRTEPRYLVVPPQLERYALELTGAGGKPDGNMNQQNYVNSRLSVICSDLLSSSTAWFILTEKSGHDLNRLVHQAPALRGPSPDFDTETIRYAISFEEVYGHGEWFGTFAAEGA